MLYEQSPQPTLQVSYEQNHGELLELLGQLQAAIACNYRTDRPRSPEHVGKQEELLAMLHAVLEFART
jgi:hypothetical protein